MMQTILGKPGSLRFVVSIVVTAVIVGLIPLTLNAVGKQQTVTSQASSCNQDPVNVQFRKNAADDTPWVEGSQLNAKIGDVVDVNCFAKAGSALLVNGRINGSVDRERIDLAAESTYYDGVQVRGLTIKKEGEYVFRCSDSNVCADRDSFTVAALTASPSPNPSPSPSASPACTNPTISDLNKDCHSTIDDYNLFLQDFIAHQQ